MDCWKKPYLTWQHARRDADVINRKGKTRFRHAEPFECHHCGSIHVGTRSRGAEGESREGLRFQPKGKRRRKRVDLDE